MTDRQLPLTSARTLRSREKVIARPRSRERFVSHELTVTQNSIESAKLEELIEVWLSCCSVERQSDKTIEAQRLTLKRLCRFYTENGFDSFDDKTLIAFFASLRNAKTGAALRPWTTATIHYHLRSFVAG